MSQQHLHGEWQGFQQFHDVSEVNHTLLPEIKRNKANSFHEENLYKISPFKNANKQRKVQRKKSDIKSDEQTNKFIDKQRIQKQSKTSTIRISEEKPITKIEVKRFERIPIIRHEEDCRYAGRLVYKNFIPRTSDKYMKILKEVDWETPCDKKRDIRNLHGIEFNSQFQGGNLNIAIEVSEVEYDLYMRVDSNTNGHRQWYYFSMKNEKKCRLKINIYRFRKPYSLYQRGMRPYIKSRKSEKDWKPSGQKVFYHNESQRNQYGIKKQIKTFVLTIYYTFQHQNDEVFVAAGIPYSYTFLQKQLAFYCEQANKKENLSFEVTNLCKSMCGFDIPLITIQHKMSKLIDDKCKKFIIINTRTHSGQTSSSWVLDGFLLELTQSTLVEDWLLSQNICLKIVPMLNPDGVFIGNYRTGIVGDDFNRRFYSGKKEFYPQIYGLKRLVANCKKQGVVQLLLDLHGHSILKNSFIYGPSPGDSSKFRMNTLPYYLFHNSKYFRLASCKFKTEKDNFQTARGFFQIKEEIFSLTCQNSLGLYYSQDQTFQMLQGDWQAFGQSMLQSMIDVFNNKNSIITNPSIISTNKSTHTNADSLNKNEKRPKLSTKMILDTVKTAKNTKFLLNKNSITSANKDNHMKKLQKINNNISLSEHINRQDEVVESKQFSQQSSQKQSKNRGKSETFKLPQSKLLQSLINKNKLLQMQRKYSIGQQKAGSYYLGRSSTYDSQHLKREIQSANFTNKPQDQEDYPQQMEVINQNFSDQYVSINDSDSQEDNLPDQERNYIFQYIKAHKEQVYQQDEDRIHSEKEEKPNKHKDQKQPKISGFRQIRFRSIQEVYASEANTKEDSRLYAKKLKLEPHKFKDTNSKTLISKYQESPFQSEFDDPTLVTFSQQKRLNERNHQRRTQKDPFVLYQRKQKLEKLVEKE